MALTKISRGLLDTGVSDSSDATAITIDSSENVQFAGNVGIGVAPTHNFNLQATGAVESRFRSTDNDCFLQISSDTDEGQDSVLQFLSGTTTRGSIIYDHNTTAADQKMKFKTGDNAVDAMEIDGIGSLKLLSKDSLRISTMNALGQTGSGAMFILGHNAHVDPDNSNRVLAMNTSWYPSFIKMYYNHGITFHTSGSFYAVGDTLLDGVGTNSLERMRIDTSGNVIFGTSPVSSPYEGAVIENLSNGARLNIGRSAGAILAGFYNNNGNVGSISTSGSSTAYNTSSDYRLKENVVTDWDATTRLKQLKPSRFNFIDDADTTVDGFLAHEVSDIVPEAITGEKDATETIGNVLNSNGDLIQENVTQSDANVDTDAGETWQETGTRPVYQGIDQSKLVPLLVKTIQELEARITTLENA